MPHVIVELTEDSATREQIRPMLDAVHETVMASGLFHPSHVKSRAIPVSHFRAGTEDRPFIHVQLRIRPGRSPSQKKELTDAVAAAIREQQLAAQIITVEVVDLDSDSYAKYETRGGDQ